MIWKKCALATSIHVCTVAYQAIWSYHIKSNTVLWLCNQLWEKTFPNNYLLLNSIEYTILKEILGNVIHHDTFVRKTVPYLSNSSCKVLLFDQVSGVFLVFISQCWKFFLIAIYIRLQDLCSLSVEIQLQIIITFCYFFSVFAYM